jgi:hypothetical protein
MKRLLSLLQASVVSIGTSCAEIYEFEREAPDGCIDLILEIQAARLKFKVTKSIHGGFWYRR